MRNIRHLTLILALSIACSSGRAIAQQTPPLDALLRGARIHYSQGRYERALETFRQALDVYGASADQGTRAEIHIWIGLSEAQLRRFDPASAQFATAIALDDGAAERLRNDEQWLHWSWTSLFNSARDLYARGEPDSSLNYALAATRIDPTKPGAYLLVANNYSALGRHDDMLATARAMLEVNSENPEAFNLIGLYYLQRPDSLWLGEMKTARWDSCGYYYERAISLYERRYAEARKALSDRLGIPEDPNLDVIVANLIEKSRLPDQEPLKNYIEKDLKAARHLSEVAQHASALYYASGNINVSSSRAGSALLRASAEVEGEAAGLFRARAESLFTKALRFDPNDFTAMYNLGIAQYQSQNDSLAEETFRKVIEGTVVPLSELPEALQAELLAKIGPEAASAGHLQLDNEMMAKVDDAVHEFGRPLHGFAWLYFPGLRGDGAPTGADDAGAYISLQPPAALENVYLLTGVTQTSLGLAMEKAAKGSGREMLERAIASLRAVVGIDPNSPEAWQNLIHCYRETGQEKKALDAAERYQKLTRGR